MASLLSSAFSRLSLSPPTTLPSLSFLLPRRPPVSNPSNQVRHRSVLAPKRVKYRKSHKGRTHVPTGGSLKGTTLEHGDFGLRIREPVRLSAKQLTSAETAIKRGIKPVKGAQVYMRVFPATPVCIKGNETRMGKGKGTFEFWACRANVGKVIFEVGGGGIRPEVAKEALRLAARKMPVKTEFITRSSLPRLGNLLISKPHPPEGLKGVEGAKELLVEGVVVDAGDKKVVEQSLGSGVGAR